MSSTTFSGPVTSLNGFIGPAATVASTATQTLTAAQSGSVITLDAAAGFATTLPAPAAGLNFVFFVKTAPTSVGYTILTNAGANIMYGTHSVTATGGGTAIAAADTITVVANSAVIGDHVSITSDGTNWYVDAVSTLKASITSAAT